MPYYRPPELNDEETFRPLYAGWVPPGQTRTVTLTLQRGAALMVTYYFALVVMPLGGQHHVGEIVQLGVDASGEEAFWLAQGHYEPVAEGAFLVDPPAGVPPFAPEWTKLGVPALRWKQGVSYPHLQIVWDELPDGRRGIYRNEFAFSDPDQRPSESVRWTEIDVADTLGEFIVKLGTTIPDTRARGPLVNGVPPQDRVRVAFGAEGSYFQFMPTRNPQTAGSGWGDPSTPVPSGLGWHYPYGTPDPDEAERLVYPRQVTLTLFGLTMEVFERIVPIQEPPPNPEPPAGELAAGNASSGRRRL